MATSTDHKWDKIPVNKGTVDKQIVELEEFSVAINDEIEYSDDVRRALYLEWRDSGTTNGRTLTLGIYARWLIAARLLLQKSGPDTDLSKLLDKNNATVRQLFSEVSENRRIRDANRYNPKAYRPKGDKLADVLEAIIAKLNDYFGENHGREKITVDKFFSVLVAISTLSSVVGHGPVQSFEHWLETGKRQAVPDPATIPRRSESGYTVSSQLQHIVATIVNPPRESAAHKIIVNATCEQGASSLINFAADLNDALLGQRSAIWINLASGASRRDVLKSLYNQCQIDFSPAAFDARPIDLALDLKPIRDYLTGEPVVVAFMNWDNVGGTFVALHDYLCNTHWGELIRILAQPVYEKLLLLGSPVDPKYRIVVLSSQKVSDIEPWVSWRGNIDIDDNLPNKALDSKLTALQPDKVQWYRQNGEYLGEPDAGKIFLINEIPTSTLEVLGQEWRKLASLKPQQKQVKLALMKKWLANSRQTHYDLCFLKFAAVSINGMRRSTMYRCVKQLGIVGGDEFRIRTKDDIMAIMGNFLDRFRGLIEEVDDEDVEGLPTHCRAVDLDEPPRSTPFIGENDVLKKSIRFRTREWCSLFTQAWHGPKPNWHGSDPKTTSELKNGGSWPLINFVLAEECMRQATAQMHHLEAGAMDNAYTTRRLVQAIFHGLMSVACTVTVNFPEKFIKYGLTALSLPTEPGKRFRYLYTFLYRHCVEEDQWRLGRAFGRSDVRLDLLTMFVARDKGALMITGVNEATEIRLLPQPYCVEHPALPLSDAIIRCDLLEALGRAGLDQGGAHGRRTTEWALSTLPGWRLQPAFGKNDETSLATELFEINALLPARDKEYYHYADSALRLRLDYLQSSGQPEKLVDAQNLCEGQLARIGFDKRFLKSLRDKIKAAIEDIWAGTDHASSKLDQILTTALGELREQSKSQNERQGIADILSRLGKITATTAHNLENEAEKVSASEDLHRANSIILCFAQACAICWLADRLRSDANTDPEIGLTWPAARGRSLRYYIRICMKLARLVMDGNPDPKNSQVWEFAAGLLGHARNRLGVYTRHHFRFRRERISMLLLDSARVRCWARINLEKEQASFDLKVKNVNHKNNRINSKLKQLKIIHSNYQAELRTITINNAVRGVTAAKLNHQRSTQLEADMERNKKRQSKYQRIQTLRFEKLTKNIKKLIIFIEMQYEIMQEAILFASAAEALLLSLGFQAAHARRLFLERIKNAIALVMLADACARVGGGHHFRDEAHAHFLMAKCALSALRDVSKGSTFWEGIYFAQRNSIIKIQTLIDSWHFQK